MKIKYELISLMFIVLFVGVANVYSQKEEELNGVELFYFPKTTDGSDVVNGNIISYKWGDFQNEILSKPLKSMNEPVLFNKLDANVYRYTHIGSWTKPYTIRLELKGGKVILDYKETFDGGWNIFDTLKYVHKYLPKKVWNKLKEKVDSCQFWSMPSFRIFTDRVIFDGAEWIVEGVFSKKYHFVMRDTPNKYGDEKFAALCNYIESLVNE